MPLQPKFMQKGEKGRTLWLPQISDYQHSHGIKVTRCSSPNSLKV